MMKTLLLQNQQIIMQQHNMIFMVMKQLQPSPTTSSSSSSLSTCQQPATLQTASSTATNFINSTSDHLQQATQSQISSHANQHHQAQISSQQLQHNNNNHHHHHHHQHHHNNNNNNHHHHSQQQEQMQLQLAHQPEAQQASQHQIYSQALSTSADTQQELNEMSGNYLTPAASEQDPISDKQEEDDLTAFLESDGLLQNNLLYNPQTDIGSITPYKSSQQQQQTPSYYSSGCESLTTPRIDQQRHQQRQPTTVNQNIVKNLADSFKSPTKPKINVQILPGSATGSMKNSKAKIIQRMNISEFLRHVHPENGEKAAQTSQSQ